MNTSEFIDRFDDLIPYQVNVALDDKYPIIRKDKNKKCIFNHNGVILDVSGQLKPAQLVSRKINIVLDSKRRLYLMYNSMAQYTDNDVTDFNLKVMTHDGLCIGKIELELNPSGDIIKKVVSHRNEDGEHELIETIFNKFVNGKVVTNCSREYVEHDIVLKTTTRLTMYYTHGINTGFTKEIDSLSKNYGFQEFVPHEKTFDNNICFISSNVIPKDNIDYRKSMFCSLANQIVEEKLLEYQRASKTLDKCVSLGLDTTDVYQQYSKELELLFNKQNDVLANYPGKYIGNTLVFLNNCYYICIHTKDNIHRYYTIIDLAGSDPFSVDDPFFVNLLKNPPIPKYTTILNENAVEELELFLNRKELDESELAEFEVFRETYLMPYKANISHSIKKALVHPNYRQ